MPTTAAQWQALLGRLSAAVVALDTTGYQIIPSDRWTPARSALGAPDEAGALVFAIRPASVAYPAPGRSADIHTFDLVSMVRGSPDDATYATATLLSASTAIRDLLYLWGDAETGARAAPQTCTYEPAGDDWLAFSLRFTLTIHRRA